MNAQVEIKGISTYNEDNRIGLKNHNSWSTHVLQPVARCFFSALLHFLSPEKVKKATNSVGPGHGISYHPAAVKQLLFKTKTKAKLSTPILISVNITATAFGGQLSENLRTGRRDRDSR